MVIDFQQLSSVDFALSDISVICQQPAWRQINMKNRKLNGFIYVIRGQCRVTFQNEGFTVSEGGLAYLPRSASYLLEVLTPDFQFYRINFTLSIQGETALFSQLPLKLTDTLPSDCAERIRQLTQICSQDNNTIQKNVQLCAAFAALEKALSHPVIPQLMPAVQYLQENLAEPIDCTSLASLCYLSTTRFYILFQRAFHMTPLQYRDRLLTDRAILLLKSGELRIHEIAQMLGFSDPAYFSRFFKKQTGISPKQFISGRDAR